ncbi:MAG: transketolase family protein [Clostridiales bacterium]|jgi:transketolase|nr:transketolase family protein [Clostridiales bacterium]
MKANIRKAFADRLVELAADDGSIFAAATDSRGSSAMDSFAQKYPDRFIECGIAEQNAVSLAAGLAKTGKTVFVCGPACFLSSRALEQVKVDVGYNNTNVKVIGVSAGLSYGPLGVTHVSLHDFIIKTFPNIEVFAPSDCVQARFMAEYLAKSGKPAYMRIGRGDVENVYSETQSFGIGKAVSVRDGDDAAIICCGETVAIGAKAHELLIKQGIHARVLDMFSLKPFDGDAIRSACKTKGIVVVEEHGYPSGLGEAVCRIACESGAKVHSIALPEETIIGEQEELFKHYGLTPENVANAVQSLVKQVMC